MAVREKTRKREEPETDGEIETAALLHVDILSLRQFRRNEYHGRIYVNDKLKRGEKGRNKRLPPPAPLRNEAREQRLMESLWCH